MKKIILSVIICFCFSFTFTSAQMLEELLGTSHFSRTIRLGNAYTGVAEGPEALFYNVAGIAQSDFYGALFSTGQGYAFRTDLAHANDYSVVAPLPGEYGNVGVSVNHLWYDWFNYNYELNIYNLSYAYNLTRGFSLGLTINYYTYKFSTSPNFDPEVFKVFGSAFDLNYGILYELPDEVKLSDKDKFRIGFQIKNLLDSKMKFDNGFEGDYMFQNIRAGISYNYGPNLKKVYNLEPLKFLIAFDIVFLGADYNFRKWEANYGIELSLFEILQISFGRENEETLKDIQYYTPQYPVNRYGFGLNIPIDYLFNLSFKMKLKIDYCISDWQKIKEDYAYPELYDHQKIDDESFSVGINFNL